MSTLSQFISGSDVNRLRLKNGSTLDEIHGYALTSGIRDFTAQNDHLMISMSDSSVYIGKKFNELLQCVSNISSFIVNVSSFDHSIGGDPFPTQLNRYSTGIGSYLGNREDGASLSTTGSPLKTVHLSVTSNMIVATSSFQNINTNTRQNAIKRFIYSGDDLFYISWLPSIDQLYIYNLSTGAPVVATYTYSGSRGLTGSSFSPVFDVTRCTYPEIDPATGDIVMYMCISNLGYRLTYDHSANTWEFFDITSNLNTLDASEPYHLSISGSNIFMASERSRSTYFYSTDGGDNWNGNNVQASNNWYFKGSGVANGSFYTINCEGANGSQYDGHLMRSTNLTTWTYVDQTEVPTVNMIRNNGLGTACYISNGSPNNGRIYNSSLMAKITS